ncbi:MAG: DUF1972 domain-containing protein [bacterium]|nr:DUF1972 domain-containing protein [bacterium]
MKFAILGTRGIPNNYGGFEQLAQYLSVGLVEKGHEVYVYNSHNHPYQEKNYKGVNIIHCFDPEKQIGTAGQFVYDLNCMLDARKRSFDAILNLGYTSSSVWMRWFPSRSLLITNMDGFEWKRSKFNKQVRRFLKFAEKLAVSYSDVLVADSRFIQKYFEEKYEKSPVYIAYGADLLEAPDQTVLLEYGLKAYDYNILVARMEPENNIDMLLEGIRRSYTKKPILIIGQTNNGYSKYLIKKFAADPRFIFMGPMYDAKKINNLRYYSYAYFHGHSVGGTNPSLLEAMGCRCFIIAHNNEFNRMVLGENAYYFKEAVDIEGILQKADRNSPQTQQWIATNFLKIKKDYSWPFIIAEYETLMTKGILPRSKSLLRR